MNMDSVLIWGLKTATGVEVYPLQAEENTPAPYIAYNRISDRVQDKNHSAGGALHLARIQITHVATSFANLRTMVDNVQNYLEGNKTDFSASLSDNVHLEDKEAEDIFTAVKDYIIQWKSN